MIPINNVYYMLSYAFTELDKKGYKHLGSEEFRNIYELFSEILIIALNKLIKRGLEKTYLNTEEQLSTIRGKINITQSITPYIQQKQLICNYDNFDINSYKNRIIKSTLYLLLKSDITTKRRKKIKKILVYFDGVDLINLKTINWNINYNRNNQIYNMIINICNLIIKSRIQNPHNNTYKLIELNEEHMHRLYEKFILEYYKREHKQLKTEASYIDWIVDDNYLLPRMKSDITLTKEDKILIIDAKYYANTLQEYYQTKKLHSANLYQIFTYVKNKQTKVKQDNQTVSGMLLYAKTDEEITPNYTYNMSGNTIATRTLDLNVKFDIIKEQLDNIVYEFFE